MIQNSLDRLLAGIAGALRDDVLPAIDDKFTRSQVSACIELLGNLSTRVEWRADQLAATTAHARAALLTALSADSELAGLIGSEPSETPDDPLSQRNAWLAFVSRAIRACDDGGLDEAVRGPLVRFSAWHLESELALLRTGMFT